VDVLKRGERRALRDAAVGAHEWLPMGREDVHDGGAGRASRDAAVGARERLPVELESVRVWCDGEWPSGCASLVEREQSTGTVRRQRR
jgi:hypothetical protein